jgi:hypothetical protein
MGKIMEFISSFQLLTEDKTLEKATWRQSQLKTLHIGREGRNKQSAFEVFLKAVEAP